MIARQDYDPLILPFEGKPLAKVFTGLRRVGKSGLLTLLRERLGRKRENRGRVVAIDMETLEFPFLDSEQALVRYCLDRTKDQPGLLFLDEAQEIPAWQKGVAALLKKGWDVYATGSNAHMLASEYATHLAGRHIEIRVQGLSFAEYLSFAAACATPLPDSLEDRFLHYARWGGFPGLHAISFAEQAWMQYLDAIQNTVVLRDVVERFSIRQVRLLEDVYVFLMENLGRFSTAKSISDFLRGQKSTVSVDTVQDYIRALEAAFAVTRVSRYDLRGKRLLERTEKYFAGDLGLRTARRGFHADALAGILENIVFLELRRRGYQVHVGKLAEREVDFVAEKNGQREYYQVAYRLNDPKTVTREFSVLEAIPDNFPKTVLTLDRVPTKRNGINHHYLPDWLLGMAK
jgi:predicted AAA+ superfamily ATPase